jgi:hypothetical protein
VYLGFLFPVLNNQKSAVSVMFFEYIGVNAFSIEICGKLSERHLPINPVKLLLICLMHVHESVILFRILKFQHGKD